MDEWSIATYGSPCSECGFSWGLTVEDTINLVDSLLREYKDTIGDATGSERHPDLAWSVTAYVCHVADNLHIWSERLQGVMRGQSGEVAPYDENVLAEVRGYDAIGIRAAEWLLAESATQWCLTVLEALGREETGEPVVLIHPERGELTLGEVARANCHDAIHHQWDIERILSSVAAD